MEWIDTHTHLYVEQFDEDREEVVTRALQEGIQRLYLPNIDKDSIDGMLAMEKEWPDHCFPMMGLHPGSVKADFREDLKWVRSWLDKRSFSAVGEIGLDFYWDTTYVKEQEEAFCTQVEWAMEMGLPIVIHSRDSIDRNIELLKEVGKDGLSGIFHCFTGNAAQARSIIELGFFLGIGGVVTFKKSELGEVLAEVGVDKLVLETDSPYLAPTPFRGKRNESSYMIKVAEKLADVFDLPLEDIARITTDNALKIFK